DRFVFNSWFIYYQLLLDDHHLVAVSAKYSYKVLLNPGPCIHYIWSPTDPVFTISGLPCTKYSFKVLLNPEPCIHYIWSPPDPAFTISGLPRTLHSLYLIS
ncbi:unnamed protein product, partial [Staurois parvus]